MPGFIGQNFLLLGILEATKNLAVARLTTSHAEWPLLA